MEYIHHNKVVYLLNYHAIWCPKYRRGLLVGDIRNRLEGIIYDAVKQKRGKIIAFEIMPDHVHLSFSLPPTEVPYKLVKLIKGRSSNVLRKEFPALLKMPTFWSRSYFITTTGSVSTEEVEKYIEEQWIKKNKNIKKT
jgi:putative transposase